MEGDKEGWKVTKFRPRVRMTVDRKMNVLNPSAVGTSRHRCATGDGFTQMHAYPMYSLTDVCHGEVDG